MAKHQVADRGAVEAACSCDAPDLDEGRFRADVRVEPAGRCKHQVGRHRGQAVEAILGSHSVYAL